jgi:hypothetical protein
MWGLPSEMLVRKLAMRHAYSGIKAPLGRICNSAIRSHSTGAGGDSLAQQSRDEAGTCAF